MTAFTEIALAKVNLTLEIPGRRADGMHEVASLVAFARVGDVVSVDLDGAPGVEVVGPFGSALAGDNILDRALSLLLVRAPGLKLGAVRLDKRLPVAAGIGGGSADAGALLRIVKRANSAAADEVDWVAIASELGADVPVCFASVPSWMTGAGHAVAPIHGGLPPLDVVLVNPLAAVPADKTARVFRALGACGLGADCVAPAPPVLGDRAALLAFMASRGNALAPAAATVVPDIDAVLRALASSPGIDYAAVSGAGPTCFGVFSDQASAEAAIAQIRAEHPGWWAVATTLEHVHR